MAFRLPGGKGPGLKPWVVGRLPLNASGTGETTNPPVYVTAPWKRWAAPDLFVNVAVLAVLVSPAPAPVEPVIAKRWAQQLDQPVNVAVRAVEPGKAIPAPIEPSYYRYKPQPDYFPNIAVNEVIASRPIRQFIEPLLWKRPVPQIDPLVNVALLLQGNVAPPTPFFEPRRRWWPAPDVLPNVAIRTAVEPPAIIRWTSEPTYTRRLTVAPDLYPNVASAAPPPAYQPAPLVEIQIPRKWVQPDLYPNLAVRVGYVPPGMLEPPILRRAVSIDLYPNIAVQRQQIQIPSPLDPWIAKRTAPQVEVFRNTAVYQAIATSSLPPTQSYEVIRTRPWTTPPVLFPNLAAFTVAPPPPPPPTGAGRHKSRRAAHQRHHEDVVRAAIEAHAEPPAELTKVRLAKGKATQIPDWLLHATPAQKAAVKAQLQDQFQLLQQRTYSQYSQNLRKADEEAIEAFMHLMMWLDE